MDLIYTGAQFGTYEEFSETLKSFSDATKTQFWISESHTLQSGAKRAKRVSDAKEELLYYNVTLSCIHGGPTRKKSRKTTNERQTQTFRQGCPALIRLLLSRDGKCLEVTSCSFAHNHLINDELYRHLPSQRRLPKDAREKAGKLMQLQSNKKLIQKELMKETGKVILLKDLSNIAESLKNSTCPKKDHLTEVISLLKHKYNSNCVVLQSNNILQGLYFQDEEMKRSFASFPELLFLDSTYKLLDLRFSCFIFLIEDGNGNSEIVAVCLLAHEDAISVQWMIQTFKNENDSGKIRAIMTDKDLVERQILADEIPHAQLLICLFHTLQIFRREITCEKMGITKEDQETAKKLLVQLCYTCAEDEYSVLYKEFTETVHAKVREYYEKNWHPIRKEWTQMRCTTGNFLNATNNRLECMHAKLKSVIQPYSSMSRFVHQFFCVLKALRGERDHNAVVAVQKVPIKAFPPASPEAKYQNFLQPYPFKFLLKQIKQSEKQELVPLNTYTFCFLQNEMLQEVNSEECSCSFRKSMRLPCRHILAARKKMNIPLYDETLCDNRWSRVYYFANQRVFKQGNGNFNINEHTSVEEMIRKSTTLTAGKKFKTAMDVAAQLANIASESSGLHFERKVDILNDLLRLWKDEKEVIISELPDATERSIFVAPVGEVAENDGDQIENDNESRNHETEHFVDSCKGIILPTPIKRKGRPKGSLSSVIGLKKKCPRNTQLLQQQRTMLLWFVEESIADFVLRNGTLIKENEVESRPERVPTTAIERGVNFSIIRSFFENDAWQVVTNILCYKLNQSPGSFQPS